MTDRLLFWSMGDAGGIPAPPEKPQVRVEKYDGLEFPNTPGLHQGKVSSADQVHERRLFEWNQEMDRIDAGFDAIARSRGMKLP